MGDVAIRVEGLSKRYRIGGRQRYKALRDTLTRTVYAPFRSISALLNGGSSADAGHSPNSFIWALKDVSFEIKRGEVVGIIGRNGSGKSTLLKVLSRITEPTSGHAEIHGRVGSLLEVGTGFHPELTGRENIYLNGAIIGMRRQEIDRKFDEIVSFAEVEKFIDMPVKYYSSGMYVRLAFAVAAHLEPEVLLVDEVLAVGDHEFQRKCLSKMEDVGHEGRTVLFVSHHMGTIQHLCSRVILLHEGKVIIDGPSSEVTAEYLLFGKHWSAGEQIWLDSHQAPGDDFVRVCAVRSLNQEGNVCAKFDVREPVILEIEYRVLQEVQIGAHFELFDALGRLILTTKDNLDSPWSHICSPEGIYRARCYIPGDFLNDGHISVSYAIITGHHGVHAGGYNTLVVTVEDGLDPGGVRGDLQYEWSRAAVRPGFCWTVERQSSDA